MTRAQMPGYLAETHGVPVKLSSLDKLAMQKRLVPDKYFGNTSLYTPQTADKLASELLMKLARRECSLKRSVVPRLTECNLQRQSLH
jgi:hypothetical protein